MRKSNFVVHNQIVDSGQIISFCMKVQGSFQVSPGLCMCLQIQMTIWWCQQDGHLDSKNSLIYHDAIRKNNVFKFNFISINFKFYDFIFLYTTNRQLKVDINLKDWSLFSSSFHFELIQVLFNEKNISHHWPIKSWQRKHCAHNSFYSNAHFK